MKTTYKGAHNYVCNTFYAIWNLAVEATEKVVEETRHKEGRLRGVWLNAVGEWENDVAYALLKQHREDSKPIRMRYERMCDAPLHPVVRWLIEDGFRPVDWQQLMCEWPTPSKTKPGEIAYARDEQKILDDKQTVTPVGKYIARHWANLPSSITRDYVAAFNSSGKNAFAIWATLEGVITGVEMGPPSCMKSRCGASSLSNKSNALHHYRGFGDSVEAWYKATPVQREDMEEPKWTAHPYAVYDPSLGWGLAVRLDAQGRIVGRAVVHRGKCIWVRSFKQAQNNDGTYHEGGYSYTDEALESWLISEGYTRHDGWNGYNVRAIKGYSGDYLMPYIDGDDSCAEYNAYDKTFTIGSDGADAQDISGYISERERVGTCEDCGETIYEDDDDYRYIGHYADHLVCSCCCEDYTRVTGQRNGRVTHYYVNCNEAVEVDGEEYDENHLPDYIKICGDGEYRHVDDCIYVDNRDDYYDAYDVVMALDEDGNTEAWHKDDAYEGDDGKWYQSEEAWDAANKSEESETEGE